jgi:hypothetical protein
VKPALLDGVENDAMGWARTLSCCLVAGVIQFLVGCLFYAAVPLVAPAIPPQYENAALFRTWTGGTRTYMLLHPFGYGFVFALVYCGLRSWCTFPAGGRGGCIFGAGVFLVGSLPVFVIIYASFMASVEVVASWVLQSACKYVLAGASIGIVADLRKRST